MQIIFTISDEKVHRIVEATSGLYTIPTDINEDPMFTPGQWAKEKLRRDIIDMVCRYERKIAASLIEREDDLVS